MDVKTFVCRDDSLAALFPGWRRALAKRGFIVGTNPFTEEETRLPTWDPSPDEPFPLEAHCSLDDVPGALSDWNALTLETLTMVFERDPDAGRPGPLLLGPYNREVHHVPPALLKDLSAITAPFADLAERIARFEVAQGHASEHGEDMRLPLGDYFDLPLEALRDKTFRVEDLEAEGYGSRVDWRERFEKWEKRLEGLSSIARSPEENQSVFYVHWHDGD